MKTEESKVLEIDEQVGKYGRITTSVILYVDFKDEDGILKKVNSYRKIFIKVKKGKDIKTSVYEADGFIKMEQLMDLHNDTFSSNFDLDAETKITFKETY